jgi:hypothetical protein
MIIEIFLFFLAIFVLILTWKIYGCLCELGDGFRELLALDKEFRRKRREIIGGGKNG